MFCTTGTLNSVDTQTLVEWGGKGKNKTCLPTPLAFGAQRTNLFPLLLNSP